MSLQLPQLKSYLKILRVPYFLKNTDLPIISDMIKTVIKESHIFNNIILASQPCVIKISPKSDMAIIRSISGTPKIVQKLKDLLTNIST